MQPQKTTPKNLQTRENTQFAAKKGKNMATWDVEMEECVPRCKCGKVFVTRYKRYRVKAEFVMRT